MNPWPMFRFRLAALHLAASALIAALVAFLVFYLWYPAPYRALTGGLNLFLMIVAVDLVCGPLFTLILANPKKSKRELTLDLLLVALIQLGALGYGLYTVKQARPVVLAFNGSQMAVVTEAEIDHSALPAAPEGMRQLPWFGMLKTGLREPADDNEQFERTMLLMQEVELAWLPNWWRPYEEVLPELKQAMQPASALQQAGQLSAPALAQAVQSTGLPVEQLFYLPLASRYRKDWVVLLNQEGMIVGHAQLGTTE